MDSLERFGDGFLTGVIAVAFVVVVMLAASNQEAKELEVSGKKPKHPMEGVIERKCKETGIYCPVVEKQIANHGDWAR